MSYISFYKIIFIIELLIAEYLFSHNLKKKKEILFKINFRLSCIIWYFFYSIIN